MIVVYSGTRNLYKCMLPAIKSLLEHNTPKKIYILIEDDSFPYELPDIVQTINVAPLAEKYFPSTSANIKSQFTYMAMIRICYPEIFANEDKILQLDVDTIVCDDLTPLWDIDLTGKWFAACPEYMGNYNPFQNDRYYNIGVCLFNLAQMRKDNTLPYMLRMLNKVKMHCVEQDAFNFFGVPEYVKEIPVRYNESFCCGYTEHPAVVHFAGFPDWWDNPLMMRRWYLDKYIDAEVG